MTNVNDEELVDVEKTVDELLAVGVVRIKTRDGEWYETTLSELDEKRYTISPDFSDGFVKAKKDGSPRQFFVARSEIVCYSID